MKFVDRKFLNIQTPTCHASSMAFYKGFPIFSWFGGSREGNSDSSIYIQYKDQVKSLGTGIQIAHWNPILFSIDDELFLAYKVGRFCDSWQTFIINISDIEQIDDLNKIKKQVLCAGLNFAVKTKPVKKDGFIYCGSSVETIFDWTSFCETYVYKNDEFVLMGRSLPISVPKKRYKIDHPVYGIISGMTTGIIQPSLWIDFNGILNAFFRSSNGLNKIYHSKGELVKVEEPWNRQWSSPQPTKFDNPNSGIDVVYINGRLFLAYNPSLNRRSPLVIRELNDDFEIVDEMIVQNEVNKEIRTQTYELSYPYLIEYENKLHLVYTYGRSAIEYVVMEI